MLYIHYYCTYIMHISHIHNIPQHFPGLLFFPPAHPAPPDSPGPARRRWRPPAPSPARRPSVAPAASPGRGAAARGTPPPGEASGAGDGSGDGLKYGMVVGVDGVKCG